MSEQTLENIALNKTKICKKAAEAIKYKLMELSLHSYTDPQIIINDYTNRINNLNRTGIYNKRESHIIIKAYQGTERYCYNKKIAEEE